MNTVISLEDIHDRVLKLVKSSISKTVPAVSEESIQIWLGLPMRI